MKPGSLHWAGTIDNCVVVGEHIYAASNIRETVLAFVHAFIMDELVTNTRHDTVKTLLLRQMADWLDHFGTNQVNGKLRL